MRKVKHQSSGVEVVIIFLFSICKNCARFFFALKLNTYVTFNAVNDWEENNFTLLTMKI